MNEVERLLKDQILGVAHVGFVVPDMQQALASFYTLYGLKAEDVRHEPAAEEEALTRFAFFSIGGQEFELIEPVSAYFKEILLEMPSGGGGINHIAWRVADLEEAIAGLAHSAIYPGHVTPDGAVTFGDKKMVYLDPETTGGLVIELIEYLEH